MELPEPIPLFEDFKFEKNKIFTTLPPKKENDFILLPHKDIPLWNDFLKNTSSPIDSFEKLEQAIPTYKHLDGLKAFYTSILDDDEKKEFWLDIQYIQKLALSLPIMFPENMEFLPCLFTSSKEKLQTYSKKTIAVLLSAMIFDLFPHLDYKNECNFKNFFYFNESCQIARINCIFTYFRTLRNKGEYAFDSNISFFRNQVSESEFHNIVPDLASCSKELCPFNFILSGSLTQNRQAVRIDFANKYIGGGVLSSGCVQEEILFVEYPECLVSMLLTSRLVNGESLAIIGASQYSVTSGYARRLKYKGPYTEQPHFDNEKRLMSLIVGIDAIHFSKYSNQFSQENMLREIVKAYSGFSIPSDILGGINYSSIATGNWGCGAFRGNVQLKSLLQWIAASLTDRSIDYYAFENAQLNGLPDFAKSLTSQHFTIGQLWTALLNYSKNPKKNGDLFSSLVFNT